MTRIRRIGLLAAAAVVPLVALAVAGCGGNDNTPTATVKPASAGSGTVRVANTSLGKILVDAKGRTLYLFEQDTGTKSTCSGGCATMAAAAPNGKPTAGSGAKASLSARPRARTASRRSPKRPPALLLPGRQQPGDTNGQGVNGSAPPGTSCHRRGHDRRHRRTQRRQWLLAARSRGCVEMAAVDAAAPAAYAVGALLLAGEAAVHVQQYVAEFHEVRWIGPLFLANAAAVLRDDRRPDPAAHSAACGAGRRRDLRGRARQPRHQLRDRAVRLAGGRIPHARRARADHRGRGGDPVGYGAHARTGVRCGPTHRLRPSTEAQRSANR